MPTNVSGTKDVPIMKCPVCKTPELQMMDVEDGLTFYNCPQCCGNWVKGAEYWKWLEQHGPNLPERSAADSKLLLAEPGFHIDCPECRFRMVKYLVGHGLSFTLDHCEGCKGVWFDRNEWEALKERNLHDDLHSMLTSFWQNAAHKEARKKRLEQIYIARFGPDDFAEIARVRAWLEARANKQHLIAFLTDKDPFDL
ncbi:MAG: zf-TFIIB domain-containing protein [bacterium]